jgi:hypothetical protein
MCKEISFTQIITNASQQTNKNQICQIWPTYSFDLSGCHFIHLSFGVFNLDQNDEEMIIDGKNTKEIVFYYVSSLYRRSLLILAVDFFLYLERFCLCLDKLACL